MKRVIGFLVLVLSLGQFIHIAPAYGKAAASADGQECLVIGGNAEPQKAQELFSQARVAWFSGKADQARQLYEQALMADRSILAQDDAGMGLNLLAWYRHQVETGSATPGLFCRLGYFENVMFGNLEAAIEQYRRASELAVSTGVRDLAVRESERLARELRFLREWQRNKAESAHRQSDRDVVTYVEQRRQNGIQDQIEALLLEKEELEGRVSWLSQEEGTAQKDLFHSLWRANRYRRFSYYEAPEVPEGGEPVDTLGSYYSSRNQAQNNKDQIAQIRAEKSGIDRRLKAIEKEIEQLEKKGK